MHTLIRLDAGVLEVHLEGREGDVDVVRWRSALGPGISWLTAMGGGALLVPHRPGDLTF